MGITKPKTRIIRLDELEKDISRYYIFLEPEIVVAKNLVEGLNRFESVQMEAGEEYFEFRPLDKDIQPIQKYFLSIAAVNDTDHISFIRDQFGFIPQSKIIYNNKGNKKLRQKGREDISAILYTCDKENIAAVVRFDIPGRVLATKKARDMVNWY